MKTISAEFLGRRLGGTGLYLGARFGVALFGVEASSLTSTVKINGSGTSFAYGPVLGYEIKILQSFGLDIDLSWRDISRTTITFPGITSVQVDSSSAGVISGGVNFYF